YHLAPLPCAFINDRDSVCSALPLSGLDLLDSELGVRRMADTPRENSGGELLSSANLGMIGL
ncbi:MAG: hypothetical protein M3Y72_10015, partial [Acidobacteriota bacterium]|nr:hypothetical protein [Acidobacteriota bacterium]